MATYKLTKDAEQDLEQIFEYGVLTFGVERATQYYDQLLSTFDTIAQTPLLYPAMDEVEVGFRRCVTGSHSIYYEITDTGVLILFILGMQEIKRRL